MLQKRLFILSTFLLVIVSLRAQVNLQTGSATFSLPMFNWQDTKSRLNTVVALSYSSGSGLKVDEVASNVGQGWNLVAGGVIARMQVGEPDDQKGYDGSNPALKEKDITKYPNGYLYTLNTDEPPGKGCPEALTKYPIYGSANHVYKQHNSVAADRQLDYFSFQFNGKAGMFVLSTNGGVDHGVMLGDTKMKITFQRDENLTAQGIRTTITSFTIRDVDGLIYKFAQKGLTKVLENNYCDANLGQRFTQPTMKAGGVYHQAGFENTSFVNPWVVGSWYLTEIEDAPTGRKILFNYGATRDINNVAGQDISYDKWHDYVIITHKTSISKTPVLTSIATPDGHTVAFDFGKDRIDLTGEKALTKVDITYQSRYLSRYLLNTTYFILNRYGTPTSAYQKRVARLCLRSVQKIGVDLKEDSPPYTFDYYLGSNNAGDFVPPPFFYAHDVWGYYNGDNSRNFDNTQSLALNKTVGELSHNELKGLCFLRTGETDILLNPKPGYAKNGLLRQIIYPTGGTLTYEYDQNSGKFISDDENDGDRTVGGVHVSKTSSTDGGYSNGCDNALTTQYRYVLGDNASSMWGLEKPNNSIASTMHYGAEYKVYRWKLANPFGYCDYKYKYPGILSENQSIGLSDFQRIMAMLEPVLGILSFVSTVMDVVTVACGSTGFWAWAAVVVDIVGGLITLGVSCLSNNTKDGTSIICYNFDLNTASPLPTQFKRVEVIEGTGGIGKTVQEFTSSDDYALWVPDNPNFAARQRFAPWAYGLPKITTIYDKDGNPVKQTQNDYDFYNAQGIIDEICFHCPPPANGVWSTLVSCKCLVTKSSSQRDVDWTNPDFYATPDKYTINSIPDMEVELYPMYTGRVELMSTHEKVYKVTDQSKYVETITYYTYNLGDPNYEVNSISTTQSNGDTYYKYIKYGNEFAGGVYDLLDTFNMVVVPMVSRENISRVNGGLSGYVSEKVTEFTQLGNGDIKPLRALEERTDRPNNSSWSFYNGPNSTDYSKFKVTQTFSYDAASNLISAKDEGNRVISNIYGYSDKYVIASVINADPAIDKPAYSSFEVEGANGGWQLTGNPSTRVSGGITGDWAFNLNGNSFSATLNTAKSYLLSFWANNSSVVVTGGATLKISAPAINGYTYYQYDIAAGTSSVTVNGNANIDELRLYPSTARMRTVTYDPLIGKTSECDENNRATYYEYDNLARLRFIKDENKNIVKMYEYNNVSKQNGCPGIYYNHMIVETFTKSNCGTGYQGGEVTYTVAANKYSSTISQEDADAQAENEILTNGQANADNASASSSCKLLYYNAPLSKTFTTETCDPGYEGGPVTYTVPANKYYSTIDTATANQMARDEIDANGQAHANDPAYAVCVYDTNPVWEWKEGDSTYCGYVNGELHLFKVATNINPNSSNYLATEGKDVGTSESCVIPTVSIYYDNQIGGPLTIQVQDVISMQNYYFTANGHDSGVLGDVPPGTYNITVNGTSYFYAEVGCGYYNEGPTPLIFYGIPINSSCNFISIY